MAQVAGPGVGRVPALPELDRTPDDTANWFWGPEAPGPSGSALCGWAGCFLIRGTHVLETVCHTRFPWDQRDGPLPQGRCLLARARRWPVVWGEGTLGCGPRQPSASGDLSLVCEKEGQPWGTELAVTGVFVVSATALFSVTFVSSTSLCLQAGHLQTCPLGQNGSVSLPDTFGKSWGLGSELGFLPRCFGPSEPGKRQLKRPRLCAPLSRRPFQSGERA